MKRILTGVLMFIAVFIVCLCLSSQKAHAADTFKVYVSDTPRGTIITDATAVVDGQTLPELLRASMCEDVDPGLDKLYDSWKSGDDDTEISGLSQWGRFLRDYWDSNDLSTTKKSYFIFKVSNTYYSVIANDKFKQETVTLQDGKVELTLMDEIRRAFLASCLDYTYYIYSPNVVGDSVTDLGNLAVTSASGVLSSEDVFLDYMIHPFLGAVPMSSDKTSVQTFYTYYAHTNSVYKDFGFSTLKYPGTSNESLECNVSTEYQRFIKNHIIANDGTVIEISVTSDLLPYQAYNMGVKGEVMQAFTLLNTLVPLAYVTEWTPLSSYGLYSIWNTSGWKISDNASRTMRSSTLMWVALEADSDYTTAHQYTSDWLKGAYYRLSYLTALVPTGQTTEVSVDDVKIAMSVEEERLVYINVADGYYYMLSDPTNTPSYIGTTSTVGLYHSDMGFSLKKLGKAETAFTFLKVPSYPVYRALYYTEAKRYPNIQQYDYKYGANTVKREYHLVAIPENVYEGVKLLESVTYTSTDKKSEIIKNESVLVETGRKVSIDYTGANAIDMTLNGKSFSYSNNNTNQAAGAFYNTYGRIQASKDPTENKLAHEMVFDYESGHPVMLLSSSYIEESGLLNWLQTADATRYLAQYSQSTGYTASTLYTRLTSSGVSFNPVIDNKTDVDRLLEIGDELDTSKSSSVNHTIFTFIAFMGILLIAYAACLVVAYYLDIFNTFTSFSILNIITFGGCRAVHNKQELVDMGITDVKQQRKYVTLKGILARWCLCTLLGILLFSSSKVFIWVMMLYEKLMALFGL